MARNEEILKLIDEEMGIDNYGSCDFQVGVIYGVRYADKTMIEKACKWIKENFECYVGADVSPYYIYADDFVEDFRKAMQNE